MNNITHDYILDYLRDVQPKDKGIIEELELEAKKTDVPIVPLEVKSFITTILSMKRPANILEIGTAIGYSAIVMSQYLQEGGKVYTIERNPKMLARAYPNIKRAGLEHKIEVLEGSADEILPTIDKKFDFIFIDAAKGQYNEFLRYSKELLDDNGIIIADNVLHKGMIAKSRYSIPRRQRTIHKRMRNFIWDILNCEGYKSSVLPIGDGVAICYKEGASKDE